MTDAAAFIENFLEHRDPDYDPVKRREYYLRTRELKGRQNGQAANAPVKTVSPPKKVVSNKLTPQELAKGHAFVKKYQKLYNAFDKLDVELQRLKAQTGLSEEKREAALNRILDLKIKLLDTSTFKKYYKEAMSDKSLLKYLDILDTQRRSRLATQLLKEANSRSSSDKKRMTP